MNIISSAINAGKSAGQAVAGMVGPRPTVSATPISQNRIGSQPQSQPPQQTSSSTNTSSNPFTPPTNPFTKPTTPSGGGGGGSSGGSSGGSNPFTPPVDRFQTPTYDSSTGTYTDSSGNKYSTPTAPAGTTLIGGGGGSYVTPPAAREVTQQELLNVGLTPIINNGQVTGFQDANVGMSYTVDKLGNVVNKYYSPENIQKLVNTGILYQSNKPIPIPRYSGSSLEVATPFEQLQATIKRGTSGGGKSGILIPSYQEVYRDILRSKQGVSAYDVVPGIGFSLPSPVGLNIPSARQLQEQARFAGDVGETLFVDLPSISGGVGGAVGGYVGGQLDRLQTVPTKTTTTQGIPGIMGPATISQGSSEELGRTVGEFVGYGAGLTAGELLLGPVGLLSAGVASTLTPRELSAQERINRGIMTGITALPLVTPIVAKPFLGSAQIKEINYFEKTVTPRVNQVPKTIQRIETGAGSETRLTYEIFGKFKGYPTTQSILETGEAGLLPRTIQVGRGFEISRTPSPVAKFFGATPKIVYAETKYGTAGARKAAIELLQGTGMGKKEIGQTLRFSAPKIPEYTIFGTKTATIGQRGIKLEMNANVDISSARIPGVRTRGFKTISEQTKYEGIGKGIGIEGKQRVTRIPKTAQDFIDADLKSSFYGQRAVGKDVRLKSSVKVEPPKVFLTNRKPGVIRVDMVPPKVSIQGRRTLTNVNTLSRQIFEMPKRLESFSVKRITNFQVPETGIIRTLKYQKGLGNIETKTIGARTTPGLIFDTFETSGTVGRLRTAKSFEMTPAKNIAYPGKFKRIATEKFEDPFKIKVKETYGGGVFKPGQAQKQEALQITKQLTQAAKQDLKQISPSVSRITPTKVSTISTIPKVDTKMFMQNVPAKVSLGTTSVVLAKVSGVNALPSTKEQTKSETKQNQYLTTGLITKTETKLGLGGVTKESQVLKPVEVSLIETKSQSKLNTQLVQNLIGKVDMKVNQGYRGRYAQSSFNIPRTPRFEIPVTISDNNKNPLRQAKVVPKTRSTALTVEFRRRGKFMPIAKVTNVSQGIIIGKQAARQTLGASFRIKTGKGGFIPLAPSEEFRLGKGSGILVQKAPRRLSSIAERKNIIQSRKSYKVFNQGGLRL